MLPRARENPQSELSSLERKSGGRLGVFSLDTGTGASLSYRANERFAMCSTFKLIAVAAVLSRVDRGDEDLERHIAYSRADILAYAPVATEHLKDGFMTVGTCCAAAIEWSDNTAANLLLNTIGGPKGFTSYARSIGDPVTTLDRREPALNSALPGDPRDTTTPRAMATNMQRLVLGNKLSATSCAKLAQWLVKSKTGATCLRAGLPPSWIVGDKTGSGGPNNAFGDSGTRNDVAVVWPKRGAPLVIAAYLTGSALAAANRDATLATVARIVSAR
ncbi:MAG TPA: class A beta-lactamase [Candidatus Rubrimentiphilum sp.]|nr:class A beta-lactamase [Candidatus Rubrimentiphilum sp.]